MAKVISFSGPQGSGKTTLLNMVYDQLSYEGVNVIRDDYKVSRAVQAELGWDSLDVVKTDLEKMLEFQSLVALHKTLNLQFAVETAPADAIILTERSHDDIAAYTQLWFNKFPEAERNNHREKYSRILSWCHSQRREYVGGIYVPFMKDMIFDHDPHRGYQDDIPAYNDILYSRLKDVSLVVDPRNFESVFALHEVTKFPLLDRVKEVCDFIKRKFV